MLHQRKEAMFWGSGALPPEEDPLTSLIPKFLQVLAFLSWLSVNYEMTTGIMGKKLDHYPPRLILGKL